MFCAERGRSCTTAIAFDGIPPEHTQKQDKQEQRKQLYCGAGIDGAFYFDLIFYEENADEKQSNES
ncbi:hypothetical protein B1691_16355 [Geobacillus sp. 47C-IIb]|jgi:hypothetical protein|nr:hypothetical protein [Geobacillus thermodenitrificans]OQP08229.1 hypothetical protein B1691_16355 [Geobacillus sp. 47C-IIb]